METIKSEPHLSTYFHQKGRRLGLPVAGNFELTARCNFRCPMCYVHQTPEALAASGRRELTAGQWLDIARQARDQGLIFALLTGGEPLMREDFFEIYSGMKRMGLLMSVNSNGSLLGGENLRRFLEDPPYRFNISLYGGSNETYRRMCGIAAYDRVKENIRALRGTGVQVSLNLSITPYNCDDLERIYADALELDVNVKASSYMYPPIRLSDGSYGCGNRLSPENAARCAVQWDTLRLPPEEFRRRGENMGKMLFEREDGCPVEEETGVKCRAGSTSFWLTWDGTMLPCGMMTFPAVRPLEEGFPQAWQRLREETARIRTPSECARCAYEPMCGVCAAVCVTETGRFDGVPTYVCEKTKAQIRLTRQICGEGESI